MPVFGSFLPLPCPKAPLPLLRSNGWLQRLHLGYTLVTPKGVTFWASVALLDTRRHCQKLDSLCFDLVLEARVRRNNPPRCSLPACISLVHADLSDNLAKRRGRRLDLEVGLMVCIEVRGFMHCASCVFPRMFPVVVVFVSSFGKACDIKEAGYTGELSLCIHVAKANGVGSIDNR